LCALSDVKDFLFPGSNQTSTDDSLIQRLITGASEWIASEIGRSILAGNVTETHSGNDTRLLFVRRPPIVSVTNLYVDGNAIPAKSSNVADYLTGNGYVAVESQIQLFGYLFTRGLGNIQITYRGGFNSVPADIEQACIELVGWAYREKDRLGQSSKSLAGEVVSFSTDALSNRSKRALERTKRVIPS
jgi:hypothetical protein